MACLKLTKEKMIKKSLVCSIHHWDHPWCWHGMPEEFMKRARELWKVN